MTGVTLPACMSSLRVVRSSAFSFAMKNRSSWLTNRDRTYAPAARGSGSIHRPGGPPTITYLPVGFRARRHSESDRFPTLSRMRS
jgi:hypothetical protein